MAEVILPVLSVGTSGGSWSGLAGSLNSCDPGSYMSVTLSGSVSTTLTITLDYSSLPDNAIITAAEYAIAISGRTGGFPGETWGHSSQYSVGTISMSGSATAQPYDDNYYGSMGSDSSVSQLGSSVKSTTLSLIISNEGFNSHTLRVNCVSLTFTYFVPATGFFGSNF